MIKKIIKYPNGLLRKKSIDTFASKKLIQNLKDTMIANNGAGLSAVQIGCLSRVFVTRSETYINPVILKCFDEKISIVEGCLSIPGVEVLVKRPSMITVEFTRENGERPIKILSGLEARVFQHEMDHLAGVLIVDYEL
jgi:peptide deformylase